MSNVLTLSGQPKSHDIDLTGPVKHAVLAGLSPRSKGLLSKIIQSHYIFLKTSPFMNLDNYGDLEKLLHYVGD